jgi:transcriptional regulator with XRE-family HTH domain
MGSQGRVGDQFRKRLQAERNRRDWSQEHMAKMLLNKGIRGIYPTTIAKIEAGDRAVKIDELTTMAELFGVSVDALLGRKSNEGRDLDYLLDALTDAAFTSRTELRRVSKTLQDRLDDIPTEYDGYDGVSKLVRDLSKHLDAASAALDELVEHHIANIEHRAAARVAKQLKRTRPAGKEQNQ